MRKVMVFGTFDILHPGHLYLFREAKKRGDFLIAVVSRDETVRVVKHRETFNDEKKRLRQVIDTGLVDLAVLGNLDDKFRVIENYKPDTICLGYDQNHFVEQLPEELGKRGIRAKIVRLKPFRPNIYKSSKIRKIRDSADRFK